MRITVLGSGTSFGVPSIGCDCPVCRSADPRDRRTRPSILVELDGPSTSAFAGVARSILVDTGPDLRAQALANDIRRVDAILFTHSHADHVTGLDDVRRYNQLQRAAISCYADPATLSDLRRMFAYIFEPPRQQGGACRSSRSLKSLARSLLAGSKSCRCRSCTAGCPCSGFGSALSRTSPTAIAFQTHRGRSSKECAR